MVSNVIRSGNKVEIRQTKTELAGANPKVYVSKVLRVYDNGELEIIMPMENDKYVLLNLGNRFDFVFYVGASLYRGIGQIKERFKAKNLYVLKVEMKTQLTRFQRREYYRFPCMMEVEYYNLPKVLEDKKMEPDKLVAAMEEIAGKSLGHQATILDISGGGVKIISKEPMKVGGYVILELKLLFTDAEKTYCVKGKVLSCRRVGDLATRNEVRMEFVMENQKVREDIIRYIFEEERKMRNIGQ